MAATDFMEETNVIPKEIHRGPHGQTRVDRIRRADSLVRRARFLADGVNSNRGLADAAIEECCRWLALASAYYRTVGLGLLADRIDEVRESGPAFAWAAFDQANATEEL